MFEPETNEVLILGVDLETTGLPEDGPVAITELGWALWSNIHGVLACESTLLKTGNIPIPENIKRLTGISNEMCYKYGESPTQALITLSAMAEKAQAIMAANCFGFDKLILEQAMKDTGTVVPGIPWIDFQSDIPFKEFVKGRSQCHIAADHGIVNNLPHRAVTDVLLMFAVIAKGGYDMVEVYNQCLTPPVKVQALVSFDDRQLAKDHKFQWEPETKRWVKTIRESQMAKLPFKVKKI